MTTWILSLILLLAPATPPARAAEVAAAIDRVSHESPVYGGEDGVVRTAAELVAITYYESTFRPDAVKDDAGGDSVGLAQVNVSNLRALRMTRDDLLDPVKNLLAATRLIRASHKMCAGRPYTDRLAHYASGGATCSVEAGIKASRLRVKLGVQLLESHPPRWVDATP
jgi:soluble lytic murein transglycosylase-like protein